MGLIRLGNKPPLIVAPGDTVFAAAQAITERNVGAATVLDGVELVGVVTERDVIQKIVALGRDPKTTYVREIMSSPVISVGLQISVAAAAELMREKHIRHLVVVDEHGKVVGMLALRYVLYDILDELERNVGDLIGYIMIDGPGG
jgi:CBS domain-containing protein